MMTNVFWKLILKTSKSNETICDIAFEGVLDTYQDVVAKNKENVKDSNSLIIYEIISAKKKKLIFLNNFFKSKGFNSIIKKIEEKNWIKFSNNLRKNLTISKFQISNSINHPNKSNFSKSNIPINIYYNNGFGTGEHPTTKGCLLALNKLKKTKNFKNPLEIGSGSGILSMAINKLFNTKVTSTEEDFQAYNTSLSNFKINKLEKKIELFNQSSISNSKIVKKSPYDLIIANILFLPIINFSPLISNISKKNTCLILSGFYSNQYLRVISRYRNLGFVQMYFFNIDNWMTITIEKRKNDRK